MIIEAAIIQHLSATLKSGDVYAERPERLPKKYIIIERTAGGETNHIQSATVAVQSISRNSLLEAAELNADVLKAMPRIVEEYANISACRLNNAYNFTDTESKQYRYQAVFDLYYTEGE